MEGVVGPCLELRRKLRGKPPFAKITAFRFFFPQLVDKHCLEAM